MTTSRSGSGDGVPATSPQMSGTGRGPSIQTAGYVMLISCRKRDSLAD